MTKKIKKINIFLPSLEKGGVLNIFKNITRYLLNKNIKVHLYTNSYNKIKSIHNPNLKIFSLKKKASKDYKSNILNSFLLSLSLIKTVEQNDLVLSMQNHIVLIFFSFFKKIKIIIRNSEEIFSATKFANNKINGYLIFFFKIIFYQFVDKIIVLSKMSQKSMKKILLNKKKVRLIFNPLLHSEDKKKFKFKNINKKFSIVTAGRFVKQKNFELLIKVVNKLSTQKYKIELTIIGNGKNKDSILAARNNNKSIKIVPWKKNINNTFKKHNVFIMPSLYEGSPNILVDALNCGIPIIASDCSGVKDILGNNYKYIFEINNSKQLSDKIIHMMNNYKTVLKVAHKLKKRSNKFSIQNTKKYLELFNILQNV